MLTEIYIEALLVDEELADQVWEAWDARELNGAAACIAWMLNAFVPEILIKIEAIQSMPSCLFSMPVKFVAKP